MRWHDTHASKTIGATSRVKVTSCAARVHVHSVQQVQQLQRRHSTAEAALSSFHQIREDAADRARFCDRDRLAGDHRIQRVFEIVRRRLRTLPAELDVAIVDAAAIQDRRSPLITATSGVTVTPVCFTSC